MDNSNKIIIDLGAIKIDLFIEPGSNTFEKNMEIEQPKIRKSFILGVAGYSRADLEKYKARNERMKVTALGVFKLASDVSPTLAMQVVDSVKLLGFIEAQSDVKDALLQAGRIL